MFSNSSSLHARRLLFTPTRPGAVVAEARARGYAAMPPPSTSTSDVS